MEWISVKESLPKKLEKVLFFWVMEGHLRNVSMGYRCDAGWNIYLPYHSFGLRADICPVTHWMELPEYPKPSEPIPNFKEIISEEITVNGEVIYIMPPSECVPNIAESAKIGAEKAKEFAKKFCEQNAELLKRLADR